jgi:hypothetical protein
VGRVLRSNGGDQDATDLAVCQPCSLSLNASWIVVANRISKPAVALGVVRSGWRVAWVRALARDETAEELLEFVRKRTEA